MVSGAQTLEHDLRSVLDPEIPVLTLDDLGVIRAVDIDEDAGTVTVTMTPTYSGCPALEVMRDSLEQVILAAGYRPRVHVRLTPAWTTDWISEGGRKRLQEFGIAPPAASVEVAGPVPVTLAHRVVACPVCGSTDTEVTSAFGSTACKTLRRCRQCREPFEEFKTL